MSGWDGSIRLDTIYGYVENELKACVTFRANREKEKEMHLLNLTGSVLAQSHQSAR